MLEPTHFDGALLDHGYLHRTLEDDKLVMSVVNTIYFSDHDAVTLRLLNQFCRKYAMHFNNSDNKFKSISYVCQMT